MEEPDWKQILVEQKKVTGIRQLEIDFDNNILKINGVSFTERPVLVTLPADDGWKFQKIFNFALYKSAMCEGNCKCNRLDVLYTVKDKN